MRYFHPWYGILALLSCLCVVACSPNSAQTPITANCRTVSHVLGETEVCGKPEKIVALGAHSLDLLLSLGEQPAGTITVVPSQAERLEQPSKAIPYVGELITTQPVNLGGLRGEPSLEALTQLKPDLIVGEMGYIEGAANLLNQIAPTISLDVRSQKGKWRDNIQVFAQALGDDALAETAIARYEEQVAAARADLASVVATHPQMLVMTANGLSNGTIQAITAESFVGELLEAVGFELVSPPSGSTPNSAPLSLEVLPEMDAADSIFVLGYRTDLGQSGQSTGATDAASLIEQQFSGVKAEWDNNAIAQSLTASKADRVYFTTFYQWNLFNGPIGAEMILTDLRQLLLAG
ncbi:MAG: iron-siderophore ABC transporter substrate-binding protein [Leptolyngbya sp. SIO4C5]|nr:iron-siderophore ABC transporter substrate-binding protein [Leptolyngbya sp. SIO4C5]